MKIHLYNVVCYIPDRSIASAYQVHGISKFTVKLCEGFKLRFNEGNKLVSVTRVD